jgi:hypothetical protein
MDGACLPDCTRPCSALPPIDGITISQSAGLLPSSVATYTCDDSGGPPADGDSVQTCLPNGTWTGASPTICSCPACDSDEMTTWTLVRHTDGNKHPARDHIMGGTVHYGTPYESTSWSVEFEQAVPEYDQFMLASGDCEKWIVMTKAEAIGNNGMRTYSGQQLHMIRGAFSSEPFTTMGYRRVATGGGRPEDPWIQWTNRAHDQCDAVYVGDYEACSGNGVGAHHDGLDVYIRNSAENPGPGSFTSLQPTSICR